MADLCTVADVKAHAGTSGTASDTELQRLVTAFSQFARTYTSRDFIAQSYSEIRDGSGTAELFLRHGPATGITTLAIEAVPIPAQVADGQPGWFLDDTGNVLCLAGYRFTRGRKNVRVTYPGGSNTIPADLAQACIETVVAAAKRGPRGGEMSSQTMPESGSVIAFRLQDVPAAAKAVLDRYRRLAAA